MLSASLNKTFPSFLPSFLHAPPLFPDGVRDGGPGARAARGAGPGEPAEEAAAGGAGAPPRGGEAEDAEGP